MKKPTIILHFGLVALISLALQGCTEKAIPASFNEPEIKAGSMKFPLVFEQLDNRAPDMGLRQNLYLGSSDFGTADFMIFNMSDKSRGNLKFNTLNDSSSFGKRQIIKGKFKLTVADTLNSSAMLELLKIQNSIDDTLFFEIDTSSQHLTLDDPNLTVTSLDLSQSENMIYADSIYRNSVEFELDSTYLDWLTDSTNTKNGINLAVRSSEALSELLSFRSRLSSLEDLRPYIQITYIRTGGEENYEGDTLNAVFVCNENLSIINNESGSVPVLSAGEYGISSVLGRSLRIWLDVAKRDFPPQTMVTDVKFHIGLNHGAETSSSRFRVGAIKQDFNEINVISGTENDLASGDSTYTITLRSHFQRLVSTNIDSISGFQIRPSLVNDPFSHFIINNLTDTLEVQYVYPE